MSSARDVAERPTPYALVFAHDLFENELFPAIAAEVADRSAASRSFETFLGLDEVRALLERVMPDAEHGGAEGAAALAQHAKLLYHAFHYWGDGRPSYRLDAVVARALLEAPPRPVDARARPPAASGYVQLPPHLVWARVHDDVPPEPIDGFFWTVGLNAAHDGDHLELAYALGVRAGRPGFSQIEAAAPLGDADMAAWQSEAGRDTGDDFANILPGGDLDSLHAIVTTLEALKFAGRVFDHIARHPTALRDEAGIIIVGGAGG